MLILFLQGLTSEYLSCWLNGKRVLDSAPCYLQADSHVLVLPSGGLPGGKGGFGSMLRALGSQISRTQNKEACRDLSGRRLRDIHDEERLKKYVSKKAERERERMEKKEEKLARLRRLAKGENKHEFNDPNYSKEREEATERVHDAMEHGNKGAREA